MRSPSGDIAASQSFPVFFFSNHSFSVSPLVDSFSFSEALLLIALGELITSLENRLTMKSFCGFHEITHDSSLRNLQLPQRNCWTPLFSGLNSLQQPSLVDTPSFTSTL